MHECNEGCMIEKNNFPVKIPSEIIQAAKENKLVFFCGAGVSTENKTVLPFSFYEQITDELKEIESSWSFSKTMSHFCDQPNGRVKLVKILKDRFDFINSIPELERYATRFHKELSTLPLVDTIITTNWDNYFEKHCGATQFVYPSDIALWDSVDRRVLKIHGTIDNIGSLIVTEEDYKRCYKKLTSGVLASKLIDLLATKTIVFIGFSFGDEDFRRVMHLIEKQMDAFMPHFYIVTLDENLHKKLSNFDMTPIITDGAYFVNQLKQSLAEEELIKSDDELIIYPELLEYTQALHNQVAKLKPKDNPAIIFTLTYQDGFKHAIDRFRTDRKGLYYKKNYLTGSIANYEQIVEEYKAGERIYDYVYLLGYLKGMLAMNGARPAFYYLPDQVLEVPTHKEFMKCLSEYKGNKRFDDIAEKQVESMRDGLVFHHPPWL